MARKRERLDRYECRDRRLHFENKKTFLSASASRVGISRSRRRNQASRSVNLIIDESISLRLKLRFGTTNLASGKSCRLDATLSNIHRNFASSRILSLCAARCLKLCARVSDLPHATVYICTYTRLHDSSFSLQVVPALCTAARTGLKVALLHPPTSPDDTHPTSIAFFTRSSAIPTRSLF